MFHFHLQTVEHLPPAQSYSMVQVEDLKVKIRNAIRLVRSQESMAQCTRKCGERGKANVLIVTGSLVFKVSFNIFYIEKLQRCLHRWENLLFINQTRTLGPTILSLVQLL